MAFIITKNFITGTTYDLKDCEAVTGPQSLILNTEQRLRDGDGDAFVVLNDNDDILFEGFYIEDADAEDTGDDGDDLQPLTNYARNISDATDIKYLDFEGNWI